MEATLEECPGNLLQRLKTPTGSYTDWGLERFLEFFQDTRNTELTTKGKKIEEKPRKPALSRRLWQDKMYQRYGKLEEAQPEGFYAEEVEALQRVSDQVLDHDSDQEGGQIVLAEFVNDDSAMVHAAEIAEGTEMIRSEGAIAINEGRSMLDRLRAQRRQALKEDIKRDTIAAIVEGETEGLAAAAAMLAEQVPTAAAAPDIKKETRRKKQS
jgi:hypothetical protein